MSENETQDDAQIPNGAHTHDPAGVCQVQCPGYLGMLAAKTLARVGNVQTTNDRGEWVPAIPEPWFLNFGGVKCDCGAKFRNRRRYREHFALVHTLGLS